VLGCLGATAAQALLGREFRSTKDRGRPVDRPEGRIIATAHPASILRAPEAADREAESAVFLADLKVMRELLKA